LPRGMPSSDVGQPSEAYAEHQPERTYHLRYARNGKRTAFRFLLNRALVLVVSAATRRK
jgi:hypothetical protein